MKKDEQSLTEQQVLNTLFQAYSAAMLNTISYGDED